MKKVALASILAILVGVGISFAATQSYKLKVSSMHCDKCTGEIEKALKQVESAEIADVDLEAHALVVKFDNEKADLKKIEDVMKEAGFAVENAEEVKAEGDTR